MNLYQSADRKKIQDLISDLLSRRNGNGFIPGDLATDILMHLISSMAKADELTPTWVFIVACSMLKENKTSLKDFEAIFQDKYSKNGRVTGKANTYYFYVPICLALPSESLEISFALDGIPIILKDHSIVIKSPAYKHIRNAYTIDPFLIAKPSFRKWLKPKSWAIIEARGTSMEFAFRKMKENFNLLKGIFEATFGILTTQFDLHDKSIARMPLSDVGFLLHQNIVYPAYFFTYPSILDVNSGLSASQLSGNSRINFNFFTALFSKPWRPGSFLQYLSESVKIYGSAHDKGYKHDRLLNFWQVAEKITLAERHKGSIEIVVKRLCWFCDDYGLKKYNMQAILSKIATKRNAIVHCNDVEAANREDINMLKLVCDIALTWLLRNSKSFSKETDLEHFYVWINRRGDLSALNRALKVINTIGDTSSRKPGK